MKETQPDITQFIGALKQTILQSQYNAAKLVNTQLVQLYFFLGAAISRKAKQANWGDKVLETISTELQKELKHLRGFSAQNLKKMRIFYEAYPLMLSSCELANQMIQNSEIETSIIWSPVATKLENSIRSALPTEIEIGSTVSNQLASDFWSVSFTNHFVTLKNLLLNLFQTSERSNIYRKSFDMILFDSVGVVQCGNMLVSINMRNRWVLKN